MGPVPGSSALPAESDANRGLWSERAPLSPAMTTIEPTHGTIQTKASWSAFCSGVSKSERASIAVAARFSRTTNTRATEATAVVILTAPNDEVERRGLALSITEADLY